MAKEKGEMNLQVIKIQMEDCTDWFSSELDLFGPGIYLCENPDGCMFLMCKNHDGGRNGLWLSIPETINILAREARQNVLEQIKPILEKGFESVEKGLLKTQSVANDNNIILSELEGAAKENVETIAQILVRLENQLNELPKQSEQQKSTLTEMSDAVVNIIKATK